MKKVCLLVVSMAIILLGCQSVSTELSKFSISNSIGFGEINAEFFAEYEDENTLYTFQEAITTAVKQDGVVDIIEPEFDLAIIYQDGTQEGYHLWLGEKDEQSTLMNIEDTHTIYSISEEMTNQLIPLVK